MRREKGDLPLVSLLAPTRPVGVIETLDPKDVGLYRSRGFAIAKPITKSGVEIQGFSCGRSQHSTKVGTHALGGFDVFLVLVSFDVAYFIASYSFVPNILES